MLRSIRVLGIVPLVLLGIETLVASGFSRKAVAVASLWTTSHRLLAVRP